MYTAQVIYGGKSYRFYARRKMAQEELQELIDRNAYIIRRGELAVFNFGFGVEIEQED